MENGESADDLLSSANNGELPVAREHPFDSPEIRSFLEEKYPDLADDVIYATRSDYGYNTNLEARGKSTRNVPEQADGESMEDYLKRVVMQELWGEHLDTLGAVLINEYNPQDRWRKLTADSQLHDAWKKFIMQEGSEGTYDKFVSTLDPAKKIKVEELFRKKILLNFLYFEKKLQCHQKKYGNLYR